MFLRTETLGLIAAATVAATVWALPAQTGNETLTATATVKTAGGAAASAPVTIVVSRTMAREEAEKFTKAFESGGTAALRKALEGVPPTGSIRIGNGSPTPVRLALERTTDRGRLLTMVTDQPILFLGAGVPGAKAKEGYDFAVADIEVDEAGAGSGMLAPAAKIRVKQGVFVIDDYAVDAVRLSGVKKAK